MRRRTAFAWVTVGVLGAWSVHNAVLRPIEARLVPPDVLEPLLLAVRVAVWFGPVAWYLRRYEPRPLEALAVTTPLRPRGTAIAAVVGAAHLALALALVGLPAEAPSVGSIAQTAAGVVLEELLMRGFLLGQLARALRLRWAVVVTAAVFAAMHAPAWIGEGRPVEEIVPSLIFVFLLGLATGIARAASGSVWPGVAIHLVNNLLG